MPQISDRPSSGGGSGPGRCRRRRRAARASNRGRARPPAPRRQEERGRGDPLQPEGAVGAGDGAGGEALVADEGAAEEREGLHLGPGEGLPRGLVEDPALERRGGQQHEIRGDVPVLPDPRLEDGGGVARRLDEVPLVRAVGEIGLDYHYDFSPRDVQQAVFRVQLDLARARNLPVVIHTREADEDTLRMLHEAGQAGLTGVFHCFSGDAAAAARALATGFHLSIPGIVTFPKAVSLRDAVPAIPGDRLLVETDSPYLAPVPHRGKRNEPAHVAKVVETLSARLGTTVAALSEQTDANFDALFRP